MFDLCKGLQLVITCIMLMYAFLLLTYMTLHIGNCWTCYGLNWWLHSFQFWWRGKKVAKLFPLLTYVTLFVTCSEIILLIVSHGIRLNYWWRIFEFWWRVKISSIAYIDCEGCCWCVRIFWRLKECFGCRINLWAMFGIVL